MSHSARPHPDPPALGSDHAEFRGALADMSCALEAIPHGVFGGVASAAYGRPRWTNDIDVFLRREDADIALDALASYGFVTERTNPSWIFKAYRDDVLLDVIFKAKQDCYFDDEMARRVRTQEFCGVEIELVAPEDVVVTKTMAADEEAPWHWYDALAVIAANDLDWEYLVERGRGCANRLLSLMHFALGADLAVPARVVRDLHETVAERWA